ncbi:MAG TPA: class I SAM-dependent methyltransferase [Candidatus Limnocylindria bacterium]|nr:class I SAM-dependent methyltransferase [Candidatus Limnocylindria bacterium]
MYLDLARTTGRRILELAVGSGRIAVALAAAGYDVTGVDNDPAMLARARAAWKGNGRGEENGTAGGGSLTLIDDDLMTLDLATRFDLVILALNSLLLLDGRAAQQRALEVMRAHLAPAGRVVIDVWLPTTDDLELYDGRPILDWIRTDPQTSQRVAKTNVAHYDATTNSATLTTRFDAQSDDQPPRTTTRVDTVTFVGATELLALADEAGLSVERVIGDYAGTPWSEASERVVLIAGIG